MFDGTLLSRVSDSAWLGCRARNAARRPLFIGTITACVIALAILSLVLAPKQRGRPGPLPSTMLVATDTLLLVQTLDQSRVRVANADSTLAIVRQQVLAGTRPRIEQLDPQSLRRHDSLTNVLTDLQGLIGKVETAPLPTSYRALAASPVLISNPRIVVLLDSLHDIERQRDGLDAAGGTDPMFIVLTARATEVGRSIEGIANERRDSLLSTITRMTAPASDAAETRATVPDTLPWIAERDSARSAAATAAADLVAARRGLEENRQEVKRAQEISVISASPFAMIVAAVIFGIVLGFVGALLSEFRAPTIASAAEVERSTTARITAVVTPIARPPAHERRQGNRVAPRYLDFNGDSYRLAYLHIEQSVASPDIVAIVGDDPDVCAIAAMNFAAFAVEDARSVLVIDMAGRSEAIRSLSPMTGHGDVTDIISGRRTWIGATAQISVGRDKMIDVLTADRPAPLSPLLELLRRDKSRLGADFDTILLVASLDLVPDLSTEESINGTVITATVARTPLRAVVRAIEVLREAGRPVFGVVLWDAAPPRLAARAGRPDGGDRQRARQLARQQSIDAQVSPDAGVA
jgi:Mrp family chromosome partitioning ATPase